MNDYLDYLEHHGIAGQKWGITNGPPYPLSSEDYSKEEKKLANNTSKISKLESKSKKAELKSAKLQVKADKIKAKAMKAATLASLPFQYQDHYVRLSAKAEKFALKSSKQKLKSIKYSQKAEKLIEANKELNTDLALSRLASGKPNDRDLAAADRTKTSKEFKNFIKDEKNYRENAYNCKNGTELGKLIYKAEKSRVAYKNKLYDEIKKEYSKDE